MYFLADDAHVPSNLFSGKSKVITFYTFNFEVLQRFEPFAHCRVLQCVANAHAEITHSFCVRFISRLRFSKKR